MTTIKDYGAEDKCVKLKPTCIDAFVSLGYDDDFPTNLRVDTPWNWCSLDMTPIVDACVDGILGDLLTRLKRLEDRVTALEGGIGASDQSNWLETDETALSYIQNKPPITDFQVTRTDPGEGSPLADNTFVVVY